MIDDAIFLWCLYSLLVNDFSPHRMQSRKKSPGKWCSWSGCRADTWRCSRCPLKNKQKTVTFKRHRRSHRRGIFSTTIHFKNGQIIIKISLYVAISNEKRWNLLVYWPFRERWGNIVEGGHDFLFSSYQPTPQLAQLSRACLSSMPLSESSFSLCSLFLAAEEKEGLDPNEMIEK